MDSINHSKIRMKVDNDYSPYMVNNALRADWEEHILLLNMVNKKGLPFYLVEDTSGQRLFEKQMHYDFLLNALPKKMSKK